MLENKIWTQAVKVARGVNGDAEKLASLVRENPWLPKHWGPLGAMVRRQQSGTLLLAAAWDDHADAVAMLAPLSDVRALDCLGDSALFYALLCEKNEKRQKMVEALAPYADLGGGSKDRANKIPAIISLERGQSATAGLIFSLMTSGQMERRCDRGANVWHYICRSSDAELSWIDMIEQKPGAALLLDVEDDEGETPRSLARKRSDEFGARLLAKAEAVEIGLAIAKAAGEKKRSRL